MFFRISSFFIFLTCFQYVTLQKEGVCPPILDIIILFDSSGSDEIINEQQKNWTTDIVNNLPILENAVRIGLVSFAEEAKTEFTLARFSERADIISYLKNIHSAEGNTKTGIALLKAEEELFNYEHGARSSANRIIIVFTDGLSMDNPSSAAVLLRRKGVKLYSISVNSIGFVPEMLSIVGEAENVFGPTDEDRLKNRLLDEVEKSRSCDSQGRINRKTTSSFTTKTTTEEPTSSEIIDITVTSTEAKKEDEKDTNELEKDVKIEKKLIRTAEEKFTTAIEQTTTLVPSTTVSLRSKFIHGDSNDFATLIPEVAQNTSSIPWETINQLVTSQTIHHLDEKKHAIPISGKMSNLTAIFEATFHSKKEKTSTAGSTTTTQTTTSPTTTTTTTTKHAPTSQGTTATTPIVSPTTTCVHPETLAVSTTFTKTTIPAITTEIKTTTEDKIVTPPSLPIGNELKPVNVEKKSIDFNKGLFGPRKHNIIVQKDLTKKPVSTITGTPIISTSPPTSTAPSLKLTVDTTTDTTTTSAATKVPIPEKTKRPLTTSKYSHFSKFAFPATTESTPTLFTLPIKNSSAEQIVEFNATRNAIPSNLSTRIATAPRIITSSHLLQTLQSVTAFPTLLAMDKSVTLPINNGTSHGKTAEVKQRKKIRRIIKRRRNILPNSDAVKVSEHVLEIKKITPAVKTFRSTLKPDIIEEKEEIVATGGVQCPMDILFVVDSSGSIARTYDTQKDFLTALIKKVEPSRSHRVGLIQFAGPHIQKMEWSFDTHSKNSQLLSAIRSVRHLTGTTYIGAALELSLILLDSRRKHTETTVILVSDGFSQDDSTQQGKLLRQLPNVKMYAISLNKLTNTKYLTDIVGDRENLFINQETEWFEEFFTKKLRCVPTRR